ncbi:DUF2924 domain-containing protein [Paracoccus sp. S-4012]|nr:DUF2924 domain-containing protein [Paracoccus sp. S-4012]
MRAGVLSTSWHWTAPRPAHHGGRALANCRRHQSASSSCAASSPSSCSCRRTAAGRRGCGRGIARGIERQPRVRSAAPKPGGRLLREWNGTTHVVEIGDDKYRWDGRNWDSLSAIAREITGAHWSGPRFFG